MIKGQTMKRAILWIICAVFICVCAYAHTTYVDNLEATGDITQAPHQDCTINILSGKPKVANAPTATSDSYLHIYKYGLNDLLYFGFSKPIHHVAGTDVTVTVIFEQTEVDATSKESRWELSYNCGKIGDVVATDTEDGVLDSGDIVQPNVDSKTFSHTFTIPAADFQDNVGCGYQIKRIAINDGTEMSTPGLLWVSECWYGNH